MPQEEAGRAVEQDEDSIPKSRFDEAMGKERSKSERALAEAAAASQRAASAEARLVELQAAKAGNSATSNVTTEQISAAMESGEITQAQGIQLIADQTEKKLDAKYQTAISDGIASHQTASAVQAELDQYKILVPGIQETGSMEDKKAGEVMQGLLQLGMPDNNATRVVACRQAFGSIDSLKANPLPREAHPEVGGGVDRATGGASSGDEDVPLKLKGKEKTQLRNDYQHMIDRGVYSGWNDKDLVKEMEYVQ